MKKVFIIAVLTCIVASVASASPRLSALGVYGSVRGSQTGSTGTGLGLSLMFGTFPYIGLEYNLASPGRLGASADYWVLNEKTGSIPLSYYLGVGGFGGIAFTDPAAFDLGLRIPIGLQFFPMKKFELFIEVAPMIHLLPTPSPDYAASIGLRVHL